MANTILARHEIRALPVRQRFKLMEDLWYSIFEKAPDMWFPLAPLVHAELERRYGGDDQPPASKR